MSGVGSSPALATCETSQVLLAGVSGGFPGVLPFAPPIDWLVSISEIILKGTNKKIVIYSGCCVILLLFVIVKHKVA